VANRRRSGLNADVRGELVVALVLLLLAAFGFLLYERRRVSRMTPSEQEVAQRQAARVTASWEVVATVALAVLSLIAIARSDWKTAVVTLSGLLLIGCLTALKRYRVRSRQ
jgi:uncharacterized iron-regulated membrane protein